MHRRSASPQDAHTGADAAEVTTALRPLRVADPMPAICDPPSPLA